MTRRNEACAPSGEPVTPCVKCAPSCEDPRGSTLRHFDASHAPLPLDRPDDARDEAALRLARGAGVAALALALAFLVAWLTRAPALVGFASARMKTNTALCMATLAASLLLRCDAPRGERRDRAGVIAAAAGALLAGLSLAQYLVDADLGIDELLARDPMTDGFGRHPNRMAPSSALGFILLGLSLLLARHPRRAVAGASQWLAAATLTVTLTALLGHLFDAAPLYRPLLARHISPYTAAGSAVLAIGVAALRPELGVARLLRQESTAGYFTRRLLALVATVPIVLGWLFLEATRRGALGHANATALLVTTVIAAFTGVVLLLARAVAQADARRRAADLELRGTSALASALATAATVREVVDAALDAGLRATGATRAAFFVLTSEGKTLRLVGAQGYAPEITRAYASIPIESATPSAEAAREDRPVFLQSRAALHAYGDVRQDIVSPSATWAALPLRGRSGVLGVFALTFTRALHLDDATREHLGRLALQLGLALDRALLFESVREAQARLGEALAAAEAGSRAKDEFLAMLGHELRNPLSPILTALHIMKARGDDASARERAVIERQAKHMARLVDDLLDVSRITRGKVDLSRSPVELADVVSAAVEVASPLFERHRHRLQVTVPRGLVVDGDAQRLTQVVANLLTNAAKFTPAEGEVSVTATRAGDRVSLAVRDRGAGISAALLPRVFELFVQGEQGLSRSRGGLGLGLALVKSLVEMHGGTVRAESEGEGHGSVFTVTLPLHGAASETRAAE